MGVKHLRQIQDLFMKNPESTYTKTQIRNELGINFNAVCESLDYLVYWKHIWKTKKKGSVLYGMKVKDS